MGANTTQAAGVVLFLLSFTFLAAALAAGSKVLLLVVGLAFLGFSLAIFRKAKPWEQEER